MKPVATDLNSVVSIVESLEARLSEVKPEKNLEVIISHYFLTYR